MNEVNVFLPDSSKIRQTAKKSGYSARPGKLILKYILQNLSMWPPISSSNVPLQARATLDVPVSAKYQFKLENDLFILYLTDLACC